MPYSIAVGGSAVVCMWWDILLYHLINTMHACVHCMHIIIYLLNSHGDIRLQQFCFGDLGICHSRSLPWCHILRLSKTHLGEQFWDRTRPWQIMLFFCLLFLLTILKKSTSLVYPLFQFKDVTFILKRQFICGCFIALQKVKYNLNSAEFKKLFPKEKIL